MTSKTVTIGFDISKEEDALLQERLKLARGVKSKHLLAKKILLDHLHAQELEGARDEVRLALEGFSHAFQAHQVRLESVVREASEKYLNDRLDAIVERISGVDPTRQAMERVDAGFQQLQNRGDALEAQMAKLGAAIVAIRNLIAQA